MMRLIAERLLTQAMEDGEFDCSVGKGKPLQLSDSPLIDPAWRLSFHILKNAGLRPLWIELDLEIRHKLHESREGLANVASTLGAVGSAWENSVLRFVKSMEEVNNLIQELNLHAPHPRFQRVPVNPEIEIQKVLKEFPKKAC